MARAPYIWRPDGPLPLIKQHSVAKHEVLRAYLLEYMQTLVSSPHQEELRFTLVDGFAGGGMYQHEATKETVFGSPLVLLEAAKEAEALINLGRHKPIRLSLDYFFVEIDNKAVAQLTHTLRAQGYGERLGADIQVLNMDFEQAAEGIRRFISNKNPRIGRSIFFLDQYGYNQVPAPLIRSIFAQLPAAEVILTFHVGSFLTYASDNHATMNSLQQIGVPDALKGRTIEDIKRNEKDSRLYIQSCLYPALVNACGARYYTLFFVRTDGHGDYWLVHLSQHPRARDVMTRVHWTKNNHFIHYGGAGIDMFQALGYSAQHDSKAMGQSTFGFCFDNPAAEASIATLMEQLPHLIYASAEGVSFGELFATTCNTSPADGTKYKEALARLVQQREIEIFSPDGARRLRASTITDKDQLLPSKQKAFIF